MGEKEPLSNKEITYSICEECKKKIKEDTSGSKSRKDSNRK